VDIILPLSVRYRSGPRSDLLRLKILLSSVKKFWLGGGVLHIITPDGGVVRAEVERLALGVPVAVHTDEEVLPGLSATLHPWWRQQLLKLAAARSLVSSDFCLVLDADCFFTREARESDLVVGGRGKVSFGVGDGYSSKAWYRGCSKLGLPVPERYVNTTPFVFSTALARSAFEFVSTSPESIGKLGWSEYTLYHCLALRDGTWDAHHVEAAPLLGNAVWSREGLTTWNPSAAHEGFLSLVQSNTHVEAAWVENRLSIG
jgi:hypothetical protein